MPVQPSSSFQPSQPAGQFFGSIDYTDPDSIAQAAGGQARSMQARGADLSRMGNDALRPVMSQLMKLLSGDEGAIGDATRSQTKGVIDQYDTARRAISQFSPRGGGRESSLAQSRFGQASDIADIRSNAITSATKELGALGSSLLNTGESEQAQGLQHLMGLISQAQQSQESSHSMWASIGMTAGRLAAAYFTGGLSEIGFGVASAAKAK